MILKFKVKNFRSIKNEIVLNLQATSDKSMEEHATFETGNVKLLKTVGIYGPNASGKTNILKAFLIFRTMILESQIRSTLPVDLPNEYFKLSLETENKPSLFELTFLLNNEVFIYGFEISKKNIVKEWLKKEKYNKILFERTNQQIDSNKNYFQEGSEILKKQTTEKSLFLTVLANNNGTISKQIIQFLQKTNIVFGSDMGKTLDYSFGQFMNNPDTAKEMKIFMSKADFGITDILANEKLVSANQIQDMSDKLKQLFFKEDSKISQRQLEFKHKKYDKNGKEVDNQSLNFINEESSGTQQFFYLSAPIIDTLKNGKILFFDEIQTQLHPFLSQYLVSIFNSKEKNPNNAQLIFTTHDISFLKEDFLRRDQIYFTDKNKVDATELFSLSDISERKGVDFAKRYLEGRYNALPYIPDFEDLKFSKN